MQAKCHLRYAAFAANDQACTLANDARIYLSLLFYVDAGSDVVGWQAGGDGRGLSASFMMVENFYDGHSPVLYRSVEDDVHGPWAVQAGHVWRPARCPLPEPLRHELESLQSRVVQEWLFFADDPGASAEREAYRALGLPLRPANVRPRRLARLGGDGDLREYASAAFDPNLLEYLQTSQAWLPYGLPRGFRPRPASPLAQTSPLPPRAAAVDSLDCMPKNQASKPLEIKISTVVAVAALLGDTDPAALSAELEKATGGIPDYFEDEFTVLDFGPADPAPAPGSTGGDRWKCATAAAASAGVK